MKLNDISLMNSRIIQDTYFDNFQLETIFDAIALVAGHPKRDAIVHRLESITVLAATLATSGMSYNIQTYGPGV